MVLMDNMYLVGFSVQLWGLVTKQGPVGSGMMQMPRRLPGHRDT